MLTCTEFARIRGTVLQLTGIELQDRHHGLLAERTRRMGLTEPGARRQWLEAVDAGNPAARRSLVALATTNHTGFFRHESHFSQASDHVARLGTARQPVRLWSAAVATGEEAYSLAMALIEAFGTETPPVVIRATDIDECALAVAVLGRYPRSALQAVSPARQARFFQPDPAGGWTVVPAVRRLVEFGVCNLIGPPPDAGGPFDVIFCRNVLMYFEASRRARVLHWLHGRLAEGGLLLLDPTECTGGARPCFAPIGNGIFRNTPPPPFSAPKTT
jgi:chemotaxis protein methyltransferase CheR